MRFRDESTHNSCRQSFDCDNDEFYFVLKTTPVPVIEVNHAPIAKLCMDTINIVRDCGGDSEPMLLYGSGSTDPNNNISLYQCRQIGRNEEPSRPKYPKMGIRFNLAV